MDSGKSRIPEDIPAQPHNYPPPYSGPSPGNAPQPGFVPPQPSAGVIHVTTGPTLVVQTVPQMGSKPASTTCKSCHAQIVTKTDMKITTKTHLFALVLCLFGLWCCAPIPYCMDSCHNVDHYCPNCNAYLGSYAS